MPEPLFPENPSGSFQRRIDVRADVVGAQQFVEARALQGGVYRVVDARRTVRETRPVRARQDGERSGGDGEENEFVKKYLRQIWKNKQKESYCFT